MTAGARRRVWTWLRRGVATVAFLYPASLIASAILLRFVGDRWWLTSAGLYLPRVAFLAPLPFLTVALVASGLRRLLWTQLLGAVIALFPLMGLVLPWPTFGKKDGASIRILSFNVNSGRAGIDNIVQGILSYSPDIVLLQEAPLDSAPFVALFQAHYAVVEASTQFVLASRFPVVSTTDPERIPYYGRMRSPRFLRHVVDTPIGRLVIYNVHPLSPRGAFYALRGQGLRKEILSGRLLMAENAGELQENGGLRSLQVKAFSDLANRERDAVVIAGDTNLPTGSPLLSRYLSRYEDGFVAAGLGFGYTFPEHRAWMRLDRVFASPELRFVRFSIGCPGLSDHRCVLSDLQRRAL